MLLLTVTVNQAMLLLTVTVNQAMLLLTVTVNQAMLLLTVTVTNCDGSGDDFIPNRPLSFIHCRTATTSESEALRSTSPPNQ